MTVRCPEGHESTSTDYCDTCGSPIGAPSSPSVPSGAAWSGGGSGMPSPGSSLTLPDHAPVAAATQVCPFCGGVNVADALFCEACGYDFTTGTPPLGSEPVVAEADDESSGTGDALVAETTEEPDDREATDEPGGPEATGEDATGEPEAEMAATAAPETEREPEPVDAVEPASAEPHPVEPASAQPHPVEPASAQPEPVEPHPVEPASAQPEPVEPETVEPEPSPEAGVPSARPRQPRHTPPSRALADTWVVELWVDPDWYAVQQTEEACPSAGVPDIVMLTRSSALIGRPSGSLGVRPEVDAGADSAVSRRHAQLTSDGRRWWIEDLGSSNGTFVGRVGDPIPTEPLQPGLRVEIDRDDRIYVGAWTRLALRHATESEKRGEG